MEEPFDFGLRIKNLRDNKGWSQDDLASRIHVSKNTISRYERNLQNPTIITLRSLAKAFHVSADYLVGFEDDLIIKLHGLSESKKRILSDFIEEFIQPASAIDSE